MKCLCLSENSELISRLKNLQIFNLVESVSNVSSLNPSLLISYDVLFISDKSASHYSLNEICSNMSPDSHIFYLITGYPDAQIYRQIEMQCLANGVALVPPGLTEDLIVTHVLKTIHPETNMHHSNVIAFFGSQPGTGVTSLVLNIAKKLSESKVSVGVLGLNVQNPGDCFTSNYRGLYLDELKNYLSSRMLLEEQLVNHMELTYNFRYLAGNRDIKKRLYYTSEEISYLIHLAKSTFDVVLLDSGSQFDNALTIQSLICSDLRFLVSTQNPSSFHSWQLSYDQIIEPLGFNHNSFFMILNKYKDNINFPKQKYLQDLYNLTVLQAIPDLGELGLVAEQEKTLLSTLNIRQFETGLNKIAKNICKLYGISRETPKNDTFGRKIGKLFFQNLIRWV